MRFESLWERHRPDFPVTKNLIYLNHAAVSPVCRAAAGAMRWLATDAEEFGSFHYDKWLACYDGVRREAARLLNADPGEIAIVKNTSEGIATVALGLDWRSGDRIVAFHDEFPANQYPWIKLAEKGMAITWLRPDAPLEEIDRAAKGARLLAISYVQFLSGYRCDLTAIGEICARHGVFFFVDAIQGLGAFPFDVRQSKIHAAAADGHKWLTGPEGCGILYIQKDVQDSVEPVEFGWTNAASHADYGSRDMTLRSDAGRYEPGTLNTIGCFGLEAAMRFLNGAGIDNIAPVVQSLSDQVAEGALAKGYELLAPRTPETGAGIVSMRKEGVDCRMIWRDLKAKGIITAPRAGWLRVSPHFYISPAEIAAFLDALP
ncbi:MAG: aminotransferase class V-fold PLP-dependent enzyme [Acidobacteria bacterium]|nr:aminotransferase class V-fold PLP-dependent enzyme [Acidobacteriota bacterium]